MTSLAVLGVVIGIAVEFDYDHAGDRSSSW